MAPAYSGVGILLHPCVAQWFAGEPDSRFWGHKLPDEKYEVTAYRCDDCGYLEFFAD